MIIFKWVQIRVEKYRQFFAGEHNFVHNVRLRLSICSPMSFPFMSVNRTISRLSTQELKNPKSNEVIELVLAIK